MKILETLERYIVFIVYFCGMNLKDHLIRVSTDLFLKYGIKSVSMDDISKHLGISKKTLYNLIENKNLLIYEVLDNHFNESEHCLNEILLSSKDAIDEMVQMSSHILGFISKMSPSIMYDLQKYHAQSWKKVREYHHALVEQRIYNNLLRGQKEMLYRKDFNPVIIAKLYIFKITSITDIQLFPVGKYESVVLFKEIIKYHIFGIISENGLKSILKNHRKFFTI